MMINFKSYYEQQPIRKLGVMLTILTGKLLKLHTLPTLKDNRLFYSVLVYVGRHVGNVG